MDVPPAATSSELRSDRLTMSWRPHGPLCVVDVSGDLDVAAATRLLCVLTRLAEDGARVVVCDLSGLAVPVQLSLMSVFPTAQRRCGPWPRAAFHLVVPTPELRVPLRRMGMSRFLPVHLTLPAALAAAMADTVTVHRELAMLPGPLNARRAREALVELWPDSPGETERRQDGLVLVTELTTNAGRHVRRPFTTTMTLSARRFLIAVTDPSRQEPVVRPLKADSVGGRGLHLVTALSQGWGVRLIEGRGKTVWAALERPGDNDQRQDDTRHRVASI